MWFKKKSEFTIEEYPGIGRFYPKYRNCFMRRNGATGLIESHAYKQVHTADYFYSKEEAKKYLEEYAVQQKRPYNSITHQV